MPTRFIVNNIYYTFTIALILFLVQPLCAIGLLIILSFSKQDRLTKILLSSLIILSIVFLATINSSKINANDLINYVRWFKESSRYSFLDYITSIQKPTEVMYAAYTWSVNHIISQREEVFKFTTTVVDYLFLSLATIRFCKATTRNSGLIIATITLTLFNPYTYSLSIQILRQMMAVSVFTFVMVERCMYRQNHWLLMAICPMIHTMSLLFIVLLFIPFFKRPLKGNVLWYSMITIGISSIRLISGALLQFSFFSDSQASYALNRAASDKVYDLGQASLITILLAVAILISSFYIGQIKSNRYSTDLSSRLRHTFNIIFFAAVFVLVNVNLSEIYYRFLMFLYPFIAIIFCGLFMNQKVNRGFYLAVSLLTILFFTYHVSHSVWTYTNLNDMLSSGYTYLFENSL